MLTENMLLCEKLYNVVDIGGQSVVRVDRNVCFKALLKLKRRYLTWA